MQENRKEVEEKYLKHLSLNNNFTAFVFCTVFSIASK
jgi:hypothetical protein